ncbi:mannose-6-phosphate isomerase, class I [Exiguobacterium sp. s80]|uniref:mannose-6-phosphate isomerase, class I n=1 Tax=Exiguobacterium sp. s80 TaxID=2751209 RepID=UPI001BE5F287|nr:mannose-6-phosphate isomerase, class I [Exiguobacterium sp. s80]
MILKCTPVFQERIWGGRKLASRFNYEIPDGPIGECWGISGHPNGMSIIETGHYAGYSIERLWSEERELFGDYTLAEFPLLVKILVAEKDLSVQVHPSDEQAFELEGEAYGKTECWYVIEAEKDAEIILGHTARTKEALRESIEQAEWSTLLRTQRVKAGDFIFVPSGTIHAIGKGIVVLETQQSSDTTYRLYDFDRIDDVGEKRVLHLEQAFNVITTPDVTFYGRTETKQVTNAEITTLIKVPEFNVYHVKVKDGFVLKPLERFRTITILNGHGEIENVPVQAGDHFIIPQGQAPRNCMGTFEFIMSDVEVR